MAQTPIINPTHKNSDQRIGVYYAYGKIGAQLSAMTTNTVTIGTTGEKTLIHDSLNTFDINFQGTLTADITTSGVNGLQSDLTRTINTWYAILLIADVSLNNTPALMFTTTPSSPSLPAGYNIYRRVGWVRNNTSNTFFQMFQIGKNTTRKYYYDEADTTLLALTAGSSTVFSGVSLASFVPPTAREISLRLGFSNSGGTASDGLHLRMTGSTQTLPVNKIKPGIILTNSMNVQMDMVCDPNQSIDYLVDNAADVAKIGVAAFTDEI